jgi:hypothetical protein
MTGARVADFGERTALGIESFKSVVQGLNDFAAEPRADLSDIGKAVFALDPNEKRP